SLDDKYQLKETPSEEGMERIEWNVRDADATVVFTLAEKASGGSQKTLSISRKLKKPVLHLHRGVLAASEKLVTFLEKYYVRRLHIAASRESKEPGLEAWVAMTLDKAKRLIDERSAGL
ncbi:MAG TPA: putative molybdenum carrier protein, partial [Candidatus Saccharimonadia bacterium]|nr:putative molybdenum carrier protein [Candidatus Saccharimonadia bacterium]